MILSGSPKNEIRAELTASHEAPPRLADSRGQDSLDTTSAFDIRFRWRSMSRMFLNSMALMPALLACPSGRRKEFPERIPVTGNGRAGDAYFTAAATSMAGRLLLRAFAASREPHWANIKHASRQDPKTPRLKTTFFGSWGLGVRRTGRPDCLGTLAEDRLEAGGPSFCPQPQAPWPGNPRIRERSSSCGIRRRACGCGPWSGCGIRRG